MSSQNLRTFPMAPHSSSQPGSSCIQYFDPEELALEDHDFDTQVSPSYAHISDAPAFGDNSDLQPAQCYCSSASSAVDCHSTNCELEGHVSPARTSANTYLHALLEVADGQNLRKKRVRYEDLGMSPRKRSRLTSRLDEVMYDRREDITSDSDLIKLQMIALAGLQAEKQALMNQTSRLEEENKRLLNLTNEQAKQRKELLDSVLSRRADNMIEQANFLKTLIDNSI